MLRVHAAVSQNTCVSAAVVGDSALLLALCWCLLTRANLLDALSGICCCVLVLLAIGLGVYFGLIYVLITPDGVLSNAVRCSLQFGDDADASLVVLAPRGSRGLLVYFADNREGCSEPRAWPSPQLDDVAIEVHDVSADGRCVFSLDAVSGRLAVSRTIDSGEEEVATRAIVDVDVGPYSGVAARAGSVVVSGGTSELSFFHYDRDSCKLSPKRTLGSPPLFRGQPDVSLASNGRFAFISTHFAGRG